MPVWQAILLGLVQGLGEFLPISSSAHLVLLPWLFGWEDPGLAFDVALHWGTLAAVLFVFWREWLELSRAGLASVLERRIAGEPKRLLFWALVLATVPGALVGKLLAHAAEEKFRAPLLIAATLSLVGLLLWWLDRRGAKTRSLDELGLLEAGMIGLAQACAIIPGVSRSGATLSVALWLGYTRDAAARFSFLLSAPIIFGAGLVKAPALVQALLGRGPEAALVTPVALLAGMASSALVGVLVINWLLKYLRTHSLAVFAVYRAGLAAVIVALWLFKQQ